MSYSVTVPNENASYTVFFSVNRALEDFPIISGIIVEVNKKRVATVDCVPETLVQLLEGMDLKDSE